MVKGRGKRPKKKKTFNPDWQPDDKWIECTRGQMLMNPSRGEIEVFEALIKSGFSCRRQENVGRRYFVDLVIPELMVAIEFTIPNPKDPEYNPAKVAHREKTIREEGWTLIRFQGPAVQENPSLVISMMKEIRAKTPPAPRRGVTHN